MEWLLHWWPTTGPLPPPHYGPAPASVAHYWPTRLAHTPIDFNNTNPSNHHDCSNGFDNNLTTNYNNSLNNSNLISNTILTNNSISKNLLTDFAYSHIGSGVSHLHHFNINKNVDIPSSSTDNNSLTNYNNSLRNYNNNLMYEYLTNRSVCVADAKYLDSIKLTTGKLFEEIIPYSRYAT